MAANQPELVLATLASALIGWLVYYHLKVFSFWSSRGIKGPMPWPIFGTNIYYVFRNKIDVDGDWQAKYGKVYGIYEGYYPTLRTTDNELIKHIYIKEFSSFTDRNSQAIHGDNARKWLLWSKGDYWANQRAMISPMFTSSKMKLMFTKMSACADNFLLEADSRIQQKINNGNKQQHDKDEATTKALPAFVERDIMDLTLNVIAQSFFSIKINPYREKANKFLQTAYGLAKISLGRLIFWLMVPTPLARYFQIDLLAYSKYRYFDQLSKSIIDDRRRSATANGKSISSTKQNDLIQAFLDAKIPETHENIYTKEDDQEAHYNDQIGHEELEKIQEKQVKEAKFFRHFSDSEIRGSMTFLFIAGFDATATTIGFVLYELSHQPEAQEEVYQELIAAIGDGELDYAKLSSLTKLDSAVSESMRLYSTLIENNRVVTAEGGAVLPTTPKPIHLPRDTAISTNIFYVHRDPDYYENPDKFDLTRFYPENRDKIKSCTYMPFGIGPRNCAGMRFALLEIKLFLAKLLLKYSLAPGPNNQSYPPEFEHHLIFLLFKNTDFRLVPRQASQKNILQD